MATPHSGHHHHHNRGHNRSRSLSTQSNDYYSGVVNNNNNQQAPPQQTQTQQYIDQQQVPPTYYNMNSALDQNYDTIKNEHNNLTELVFGVYDSLNAYCNSIKEIYLNSNSFMNNVQKLFGQEHPLSKYGNGVLMMADESFKDWMDNQSPNFKMLGEYCDELGQVKSKIERVDQLSLSLTNESIDEYVQLKEQVFQEVSSQFEARVSRFDIPLINTQFSFPSLYQCLNSIHETNGTEQLQQPIQVDNPVVSLAPDNTHVYNFVAQQQPPQQEIVQAETTEQYQQQQYEQQQYEQPIQYEQPQQYEPQQPQPVYRQQPQPRVNTASSTYISPTMNLMKPVKTEIPHAAPPKTLQKVGAREYTRAAPVGQQNTPLKTIPRPNSTPLQQSSPLQSIPRPNSTPINTSSPQPSAPPAPIQQEPIQAPIAPLNGRQVLPHNPNSNNNNSVGDSGGVIYQPLRPVPHKSVQARPSFGGAAKPPLSPSTSSPNLQQSQQFQQAPPQPLQRISPSNSSQNLQQQSQQQSPLAPKPRPISVNFSQPIQQQQNPNVISSQQQQPINQIPRPQPIVPSQPQPQQPQQPQQQQPSINQAPVRPRSASLSASAPLAGYPRPQPVINNNNISNSSNNINQ